ncbi:SH3 domain-containing protein [Sphaceloma murrayae]|uniref:SH3 domain-containing protein n=1 Tax=Sphaceloma murrayae TaxID=2082308 RepID=A0A2K1QMD6_9PEZI|nr:SH3 domain-containing protein [Sphaceloma murrayae]
MSGPPFKVKAVFEYSSPHEDDLSFPNGQIITVTEEEDADWYVGEYTDEQGKAQTGLFPKNFVEKYEPEIPSRPTRGAKGKPSIQSPPTETTEFDKQEDEPAPPPPIESKPAPARVLEPEPAQEKPAPVLKEEPRAVPAAPADAATKSEPSGGPAKGPPPPVAAKSSSFKDRIAAFNKGADSAPPLPFKPSGNASSNYGIKKPFVAPPPSRNAYVPPPKLEPVQKIYRREEDPEIAERLAEDRAAAESAGLAASQDLGVAEGEAADEDVPKPQSLKDRIALLQKQQMEQAQRRADTASKEKPKRPTKKRTESSDQIAGDEADVQSEMSMPIRTSTDAPEQPAVPRTSTLSPPPMSPSIREHDILSDGNEADQSAAGETTEANEDTSDAEEGQQQRTIPPGAKLQRAPTAPVQEPDVGDEEDTTEGQSEEEEMDEETRRRMELRDRMAKISGGMGMAGMFGPQPGMAIAPPRKKSTKSSDTKERRQSEDHVASPPPPPRAMVPVPGMIPQVASPQSEDTELAVDKEDESRGSITADRGPNEMPDVEDVKPAPPPKESLKSMMDKDRSVPPPIPGDRPVPVPPPSSSRPAPPAPPARVPQSPDTSEAPSQSKRSSVETPRGTEPPMSRGVPPPVPGARGSVDSARSPPPVPGQSSYFGNDAQSEASMTPIIERRASRVAPPPVPGLPPSSPPTQSRAPPPPPPVTGSQAVDDREEGESEYEGDYDTDIASSDKHKAALKTHARQPSLDDSTTADDTSTQQSPPPLPTSPPTQHRAVPPPPPSQAPRRDPSTDLPRAVPPPLPPSRPAPADEDDDEEEEDDSLDMYKKYQDSQRGVPPIPPVAAPAPVPVPATEMAQDSSDDLYDAPPRKSVDAPRTVPPPPTETSPRSPDVARLGGRQSMDASRTLNRKSMDAPRPSTSGDGFIATDVSLSENTQWWTQGSVPPPVFQNRNDLLFEVEESSTSKRGGKTTISKDIYVLFHDYSQTVITATYDRANPADVSLEQRHEPPPPRLRQDQLEDAWRSFGVKIAEQAEKLAASKSKDAGLGDGSPTALPYELIKQLPGALLPVGHRAYGAPVYANIGNASVQQHDEIRPGDLVTFRNAKLQGKHGLQKYSNDVGTGGQGHVGVVVEWDGTKKKVRVVEQARDDKGRVRVKGESYRLGDLKSGEVRVWRVVGRGWVGWEGN